MEQSTNSTKRRLRRTGAAFVVLGFTVWATLRVSSFARYMRLEDLGLDVNPAVGPETFRKMVEMTPTDRPLWVAAVAVMLLGLALFVAGLIRWKRQN